MDAISKAEACSLSFRSAEYIIMGLNNRKADSNRMLVEGKTSLTVRVAQQWNQLSREMMDSISPNVSK